jgi:hypothetical protein
MDKSIVERLQNNEMYVDAIDDAIATIEELTDTCVMIEKWITEMFDHFDIDPEDSPKLQKLRNVIQKVQAQK